MEKQKNILKNFLYILVLSSFILCSCGKESPHESNSSNIIETKKMIVNDFEIVEYFDIPTGDGLGEVGVTFIVNGDGPESFYVDDSDTFYILDKLNKKIVLYQDKTWIKDVIIEPAKRAYDIFSFAKRESGYYVLNRNMSNLGTAELYVIDEEGKEESRKTLSEYDSWNIYDFLMDDEGDVFLYYVDEVIPIFDDKKDLEIWKADIKEDFIITFTKGNKKYTFDLHTIIPNLSEEIPLTVGPLHGDDKYIAFNVSYDRISYLCRINMKEDTISYLKEFQIKETYGQSAHTPTNREYILKDNGEIYWMIIFEDFIKIMLLK